VIQNGFHQAETEEEKNAVYRFRYDIYVTEMGRYGQAADHARKHLKEPEDGNQGCGSAQRGRYVNGFGNGLQVSRRRTTLPIVSNWCGEGPWH
jgi:hypothetical protein